MEYRGRADNVIRVAHDHHSHAPGADADRRWLAIALGVIAAFMVVEIVAGIVASSLALLSDAAHMATDAMAIALALVAVRLAARPPSGRYTFGLGRAEILSAQVNGAALLVLAGVLGLEAVQRLSDPHEVEGGIVIVVGVLGGLANVGAAFALSRSERRSLNVEGAMAHVMTDLYASIAATLSGVVILTTGFVEADGIAALVVVGLMLRSGWPLLRDSSRILLEAPPKGIDVQQVGRTLAGSAGGDGGPRPARLGGHVGLSGARRARARRSRRRLPRPPPRARAAAARPVRDRAHDAAGRPSPRRSPDRHHAAPRYLTCSVRRIGIPDAIWPGRSARWSASAPHVSAPGRVRVSGP